MRCAVARLGFARLVLAAALGTLGGVFVPGSAGAAPSGLTAAVTAWDFGTVPAGTYVQGPGLFVSSTVSGVSLVSSSADAPFVKFIDTCDGVTATIQNDICEFRIDFDNLTSSLSRGHYRTTFTISDNATGHALLKVRYTAAVG